MSAMEEIDSLESEGALLGFIYHPSILNEGLRVVGELPVDGHIGELVHVRNTGNTYICTSPSTDVLIAGWREL